MQDGKEFYRMSDLISTFGLSESTIRKMIREGLFPAPVHPVEGRAVWTRRQVDWYLQGLEAGLIKPLPKARKKGGQ